MAGPAGCVACASFSAEDGLLKLWDVESGRLVATLRGHALDVGCIAFSAAGQTLTSRRHHITIPF